MVRNLKGGSGAKGQARKHTSTGSSALIKTRLAVEEGELYAQVTKNMGNGMCHVLCQDDKTRLCFIRGKFRGRSKRDNMISNGKWVLIGLRDYESEKKDKLGNCDLLEVYLDQDKDKLRSRATHINWTKFLENDSANSFTPAEDGVRFTDEREDDYNTLMDSISKAPVKSLKLSSASAIKSTSFVAEKEEDKEEADVDIDDI